ncbi:MAG: PLP-dependent aminotransferase family protein [Pseudomonadales bacterium]
MSIYQLFHLRPESEYSLQKQIRAQIVTAIRSGHIPVDKPLPSSRGLAKQLNVARNTVILAYEHLLEDGYLISRQRSGYFVNPDILDGSVSGDVIPKNTDSVNGPDWEQRFKSRPSIQQNIRKPRDWQDYQYPFAYGQLDATLFPTNNWRECCRDAVSVGAIRDWATDHFDNDDPMLIEQIHTRLLPRRGIWADPEQILLTVGAQHALYMVVRLLLDGTSKLGLENPGYVDIRNIATLNPAKIKPLRVDANGLMIDDNINDCDCVFVTPSHQSPTTVTMPIERRYELLKRAADSDIILIEDDYESEINYATSPSPALKSLDQNDRVLYIGSLSKTLAPGLRMGYVVGPVAIINELRALRRLMLRHPAANNQRSVALFLARGYHDTLTRNLVHAYQQRSATMKQALDRYLPELPQRPGFGGSSCWIKGPEDMNACELQRRAAEEGILIEPGDIHFLADKPPLNYFRLGFSSIANDRIEPGIEQLARLVNELAG